jgi:hypothetical protein
VVGLLLGGRQQLLAGAGVARNRRLADIQGLGADLADVVDPHQAGGMTAVGLVQDQVARALGGIGALGDGGADHGFQGVLGPREQAVERRQGAVGHASILGEKPTRRRGHPIRGTTATCGASARPVSSRLFRPAIHNARQNSPEPFRRNQPDY